MILNWLKSDDLFLKQQGKHTQCVFKVFFGYKGLLPGGFHEGLPKCRIKSFPAKKQTFGNAIFSFAKVHQHFFTIYKISRDKWRTSIFNSHFLWLPSQYNHKILIYFILQIHILAPAKEIRVYHTYYRIQAPSFYYSFIKDSTHILTIMQYLILQHKR